MLARKVPQNRQSSLGDGDVDGYLSVDADGDRVSSSGRMNHSYNNNNNNAYHQQPPSQTNNNANGGIFMMTTTLGGNPNNNNRSSTTSQQQLQSTSNAAFYPPHLAVLGTGGVGGDGSARKTTASTSQLQSHLGSQPQPHLVLEQQPSSAVHMQQPSSQSYAPNLSPNVQHHMPISALYASLQPHQQQQPTPPSPDGTASFQAAELFVEALLKFNRWNATSMDFGSLCMVLRGLEVLLEIGKAHVVGLHASVLEGERGSPVGVGATISVQNPQGVTNPLSVGAPSSFFDGNGVGVGGGGSGGSPAVLDGGAADCLVPEMQRLGFTLARCCDFVAITGEIGAELLSLLRSSPDKNLTRTLALAQMVSSILVNYSKTGSSAEGDGEGIKDGPEMTDLNGTANSLVGGGGGGAPAMSNFDVARSPSLGSRGGLNSVQVPHSVSSGKHLLPYGTLFRIRPAQFPIIFHVVTALYVLAAVVFAVLASVYEYWASAVPMYAVVLCHMFALGCHFQRCPLGFNLAMILSWLVANLAYTLTFVQSTDALVFPWSVVTVAGMAYYACILGDLPSLRLRSVFSVATRSKWPPRRGTPTLLRVVTELQEHMQRDDSSSDEDVNVDSSHDILLKKGTTYALNTWFVSRVIPAIVFAGIVAQYAVRIGVQQHQYPAALYVGEMLTCLLIGFMVLRYYDTAHDTVTLRVEDAFRAMTSIRLVVLVNETRYVADNNALHSTVASMANSSPIMQQQQQQQQQQPQLSMMAGLRMSVPNAVSPTSTATTARSLNSVTSEHRRTIGRHVRASSVVAPQGAGLPDDHETRAVSISGHVSSTTGQLSLAGRHISTCGEMLLNIGGTGAGSAKDLVHANGLPHAIWRTPLDDVHFTTIIIVVDHKGDVVYWNWFVEDLTQFSAADIVGKNVLSVLPSPDTHTDMFHRISSTMSDRNVGPITCRLTSRRVGKPSVEVKLQPYPAKTLMGNTVGVVLAGAPIPSTAYGDVSNELVEIHSTMHEGTVKERLYRALLQLQAELPKATTEVSLPQLFGRIFSAQFQQKALLLDVQPSFPPTLSVDADGLSMVVTEMLQHYLRFGITRVGLLTDNVAQSVVVTVSCLSRSQLSAKVGSSSGNTDSLLAADVAPWTPSAVCAQAIRRLNFVLRSEKNTKHHCVLVLVGLLQEHAAMLPRLEKVVDDVRCNVAIFDTEALSSTLIRNAVWERKHMLFFIEDAAKLSLALDGVDILFARFARGLAERVVTQLRSERPLLEVVILLSADSTDQSLVKSMKSNLPRGVAFLEDPILSAEVHDVLTAKVNAIRERRAREATVSDVRKLLSQAKSCPWVRGNLLGRGANATVYEATNTITSGKMAVRSVRINREDPELLRATMEGVVEEIKLMSRLEHKNIINYLYMERDTDCINIFMEFAPGGSIRSYLDRKGRAPLEQVAMWLRDILEGLAYLHGEGIVHLDLKCANILLGSDGACKIADFGTSKEIAPAAHSVTLSSTGLSTSEDSGNKLPQQTETSAVGTLQFMAPEVLNSQSFDWRADIWSLGCTVMEMLTGKLPFSAITDGPLGIVGYISGLHAQDVPAIPQQITDPLAIAFLTACLSVDPARRPNAQSLQNHPFVVQTALVTTATVRVHKHGVSGARGGGAAGGGAAAAANVTSASLNLLESEDDDSMRRDSCFSAWSGGR